MAKILVVDDEAGMRQVMLNVLKPEGHQLFSAEDGAQAIEKAKAEKPNLVMLDMRLPDMDGLEILTEIKKILPETTVIMLSGFGDVESAVGAIKQGAFDYISKPFKVNEVIRQVRKGLGQPCPADAAAMRGASYPAVSKKASVLKIISTIVLALVVLGGIGFGVYTFLSSRVLDAQYTVPYSNPTSIAYDGSHIWVTDWVTQSFYMHNVDKMFSMAQTFYLQDSHPTGISFDGDYVWSSNSWESIVFKHKLDKSLTVIETYQTPGPEPSGLYWDGVYLWICDIGQAKIYKTRVTNEGLSTIAVYESPGNNPVGLFSDGQYYWVGDSETNRIYRLDENFLVLGVYIVSQFEQKEKRLSAIGWDGKTIWVCSDESQEIYRVAFKSLKKLHF